MFNVLALIWIFKTIVVSKERPIKHVQDMYVAYYQGPFAMTCLSEKITFLFLIIMQQMISMFL